MTPNTMSRLQMKYMNKVFQKELYNAIPNVAV
jgi:hypothetical protein